jgi:hypothetical protein
VYSGDPALGAIGVASGHVHVDAREQAIMSGFEKGMLVQHDSLGLGKIVALEEKAVHVFFVGRDSRFAAKLRLPAAANLLKPAEAAARSFIGSPSAFSLDAASGRYGLAESWLSHDEAVARFQETYPGGFTDPLYTGESKGRLARPSRLRKATAAYAEAFGEGRGEQLLAAGSIKKLVEAALEIERLAAANRSGADKGTLAGGLGDAELAKAFFEALFAFLAAPAPERTLFTALAAAVAAFPGGAGVEGWPLLTLLPFLAQPERHMLLRPKVTSHAVHRLGLDLRFAVEPNWVTYSTLLASSALLLEKLRSLGARDFIDVETFLTVVTVRAATRAAAPPPAGE